MTAFALQHCESRVITAIFEGAPTQNAQHRSNTVIREILISDPPCNPPLNHFNCFYVLVNVRAPCGGDISEFRTDKSFIG